MGMDNAKEASAATDVSTNAAVPADKAVRDAALQAWRDGSTNEVVNKMRGLDTSVGSITERTSAQVLPGLDLTNKGNNSMPAAELPSALRDPKEKPHVEPGAKQSYPLDGLGNIPRKPENFEVPALFSKDAGRKPDLSKADYDKFLNQPNAKDAAAKPDLNKADYDKFLNQPNAKDAAAKPNLSKADYDKFLNQPTAAEQRQRLHDMATADAEAARARIAGLLPDQSFPATGATSDHDPNGIWAKTGPKQMEQLLSAYAQAAREHASFERNKGERSEGVG